MPVEPDLLGARQPAGPERHKRANADSRQQDSEHASEKRQHRALGQALAHQPAAARAERHAHGKLPLAGNRARQQQAGHIHARNQQHQADRTQQQPERGPHISHIRPERLRDEGATCVGLRILFREMTAHQRQFGLCAAPASRRA